MNKRCDVHDEALIYIKGTGWMCPVTRRIYCGRR